MFYRLIALTLLLASSTQVEDNTSYKGNYAWRSDDPRHGGWSGLELDITGQRFVAISDRGHIQTGLIERQEGRIHKITSDGIAPLLDTNGNPVEAPFHDAEGLASDQKGTRFISFEGVHHILRYTAHASRASARIQAPSIDALQPNSGIEALAIDSDGILFVIPERSGDLARPFPVYRLIEQEWHHMGDIPRSDGFLVVGADIGPDGALYVLERDLVAPFGFRSRVRRFAILPSRLGRGTILIQTALGKHGNLEAIAVTQATNDTIRITLLSDNNFLPIARTHFVEYEIEAF